MKPNDIIYWNQYSGMTEPFKQSDMLFAKAIDIMDRSVYTDRFASKLLIDKFYETSIRTEVILPSPWAPKYSPGKERITCLVVVEDITDSYLEIKVSEYLNGDKDSQYTIGFIKFQNNLSAPINGIKGTAAVIIHDVAYLTGSRYTNHALGAIAVGLGAYLFGKLDGNWMRIANTDFSSDKKTEDPAILKQRIFELEELIKEKEDEHIKETNQLKHEIRVLKKKIKKSSVK